MSGAATTHPRVSASARNPTCGPGRCRSILRRAALADEITVDVAALAHADLLQLRVELLPYAPVAPRVWQLRGAVTAYDAWFVALAESLDAPLATLTDASPVHAASGAPLKPP